MTPVWFENLSRALRDSNLVAYVWDAGADRFEWGGDVGALLGIGPNEWPQSNAQLQNRINPQDGPARLAALHQAMAAERGLKSQYKLRCGDGRFIDVVETADFQVDEKTGTRRMCGFIKQVDSAQHTVPADLSSPDLHILEPAAVHYGRQIMQQKIEMWLEEGINPDAGNCTGYLLVVGMDHLSLYNEAFGARYTDEVIEKTSQRLQQIIADTAIFSRLDGDVFGIFFNHAQHNEMATMARCILGSFQGAPLNTSKGPVAIGVSIGGVLVEPRQCRDGATYLVKAETAMHGAKQKGRNCFVCYRENMLQGQQTKLLLDSGNAFLRALNDGRVKLAFQPVMNADSQQQVSFHECLIRYVDEDGKLHAAADFVPAVERLGLGQLVDQYALRRAIQELTMFPDLTLSVNVSHLSLSQHDWLRGLVAALRDRPSVARRLIVEITETAVMKDIEKTLRVVRTLKELGCRVALDDFGAGNTAFSQLQRLSIDMVKIDKSFIRHLDDAHNHLFVQTLQRLANGINIETVGEGAETAAEAQLLAGDGVNHIQGYVFGFPQIERVWLPRDHVHRRILSSSSELAQKIGAATNNQLIMAGAGKAKDNY